jgi:Zn-dependent M28 family amino/carboxypeptidase
VLRPGFVSVLLVLAATSAGCDSDDSAAEPDRPARAAAPAAAPPVPAGSESGPEVTRAGLIEHLRALQRAADENGGNRSAGSPGDRVSADYVSARLREAGWQVTRQPVRFPYFRLRSAAVRVADRSLPRGRGFRVIAYSAPGAATGRLRSVGDGCRAGFRALRPGEIPLAERGRCLFRVKARNAERAGARALVVVDPDSRRGVPETTLGGAGIEIPVVIVGAAAAAPGARAAVRVDAVSERRTTENVIAETPGGSPERVVMAGGHLDSVAAGPGLNDNGSGVAALLELAEAVGPQPAGARVRLAFWGAEELGLIGSRRYVRSLDAAERKLIAAYLNFDMLGSPNAVSSIYTGGDPGLERALRRAAGIPLEDENIGANSDHAPFEAAGIPIGGLYTGAAEEGPGGRPRDPCYHRPCDTLRNVDRAVLLRMARAASEAVESVSRSERYAK